MYKPEDFATLVSEDIKGKADQRARDYLRLPENHEEWRQCLLTIIDNVSVKISQLQEEVTGVRSTYSDFNTDPAESLQQTLDRARRFRFYAEKRLAEVDRLVRLGEDADPEISLAAFLKEAIEQHRSAKLNAGDDYDHALWSALQGEWAF